MYITCLDVEGVLVPEIWVAFAEASGIPELKEIKEIPVPEIVQGSLAVVIWYAGKNISDSFSLSGQHLAIVIR